jgi:hypothetical protein
MFKKWDIVVIILLIVLSFVPQIIFGVIMGKHYNGTYAEITVDGKFYKKIPLSEHTGVDELEIKTKYGYNIIKVSAQSIQIIDADCKDKICVKTGILSKPGQSTICLPHKLMVEVKSYDNKENNDIIPAG